MRRILAEYRLFLREFLCNYHTTGAVLPSGRRLARALARYVGHDGGPKRILEVGPGTGAVTRGIVERMGPEDRLDLVELNDAFVARLESRFRSEPSFVAVAGRVRVFHSPVEDLPPKDQYDLMISGLPLNNFQPAEVQRILDAMGALLAPGGMLSFFEYIAIRRVKAAVSGRAGRERLRGIGRVLDGVLSEGEVRRDWVWVNAPPAWVHHVQMHRGVASSRQPAAGSRQPAAGSS
jgi:phosphatidylethanolamine/phosphatidyl-N-methylethanolamine N-methyltransferase